MAAAVGQVDPERIRAVLERFPAVVAGFLSGSVARGGQTPLSDIDVAVWLRPELPPDERSEIRLELLDALTSELRTDRVDLIVLNDAQPAVRYNLLKDGKRIYCADEALTAELQVRAIKLYFDFLPILKLHQAALVERIKTGRYGRDG